MEQTLRRALLELEPALPFVDVRVLGDALDPQMRPWRLGAAVFTAFGLVAALLAALGLYAAVAYAVAQRTREIGVRIAVGASARQVAGLILGEGVAATRPSASRSAPRSLSRRGAPSSSPSCTRPRRASPVVFPTLAVAALMLAIAVLACLVPAWRATAALIRCRRCGRTSGAMGARGAGPSDEGENGCDGSDGWDGSDRGGGGFGARGAAS